MKDYKITKASPFRPGNPVNPNDFVGHEELITDIIKRAGPILEGEVTNYYLVGNRGMGKTSISYYFSKILETKYNILPIYISNEWVSDLNTLIVQIIETILNTISDKKWSNRITSFFGENIEIVGFMNLSFKLKPKDDDYINGIVRHFDKFIKDIVDNLEDYDGLLIIIDDVNGLSKKTDFTNWFRRIYHQLTFEFAGEIPLGFILTSFSEILTQLQKHNESFARLFNHFDIIYLENYDVEYFYKDKFDSVGITVNEDVLELMSNYTFGLPLLMQEIGDSIYWLCGNSKHVDMTLALTGIKEANNRIYTKYLNPIVIEKNYQKILDKIIKNIDENDLTSFDVENFEDKLTDEEKPVLNAFLCVALDEEVITKVNQTKKYKFRNPLYTTYLKISKL